MFTGLSTLLAVTVFVNESLTQFVHWFLHSRLDASVHFGHP